MEFDKITLKNNKSNNNNIRCFQTCWCWLLRWFEKYPTKMLSVHRSNIIYLYVCVYCITYIGILFISITNNYYVPVIVLYIVHIRIYEYCMEFTSLLRQVRVSVFGIKSEIKKHPPDINGEIVERTRSLPPCLVSLETPLCTAVGSVQRGGSVRLGRCAHGGGSVHRKMLDWSADPWRTQQSTTGNILCKARVF